MKYLLKKQISQILWKDNRSPSPFNNKDTKTEIVMAEERDTSLAILGQQSEMISKSIIEPQNVDPFD